MSLLDLMSPYRLHIRSLYHGYARLRVPPFRSHLVEMATAKVVLWPCSPISSPQPSVSYCFGLRPSLADELGTSFSSKGQSTSADTAPRLSQRQQNASCCFHIMFTMSHQSSILLADSSLSEQAKPSSQTAGPTYYLSPLLPLPAYLHHQHNVHYKFHQASRRGHTEQNL